jgi:hypothetical protein
MKTQGTLLTIAATLALVAPGALFAQSDNFNSGTDTAWSHQDPIHQAGYPAQVTFTFPSGGYRLQSVPSPSPSTVGQGRGGSLRKDVSYNTNFYAAVDLASWNDSDQQAFGIVARIKTPGLGTSSGYYFAYNNASPSPGHGVLGIYRLLNEAYTTLSSSPIFLDATKSYRLALFGQETNLEGRLYLLPDTNTPLMSISAVDANYATGYCGLAQADQSPAKNYPTDVTYDNYLATNFCIADQPQNTARAAGGVATLTTRAVGTPPLSYQWLRSGTNLVDGANIAGATNATLTLSPVSAADIAPYQVVVTDGAARSATSIVATVTVFTFQHGSSDISYNFDDGATPPGSTTYGNAYADAGSGALHLVDAINSELGSFIIEDVDAGAVVQTFDAQFDVLFGGSTTTSVADGTSFVWANDLPGGAFNEAGAGSGLVVTFELYNANASIPGPSINVKYGGAFVAQTLLPLSVLQTGTKFVPVNIRLQPGGLLSVIYNSQVIYTNLPIPGLADGLAGGRFGWGARTGLYNENQWIDNVRITTTPKILSVANNGGSATVTYSGVLQSATQVGGAYLDVPDATISPYTFTLPAGSGQRFWRTRSP